MLPERGYAVGYREPPVHTRFKKGQSGNPRGRPRGSKNNATLLREALDQTVAINENGRRRHIRSREAMYTQLANKAAQGDHRAIQTCCARARSSTAAARRHPRKREPNREGRSSFFHTMIGIHSIPSWKLYTSTYN